MGIVARLATFAISAFVGAYFVRRIGESNINDFNDYRRGNRRRVVSTCVLTWIMLHFSLLNYLHLFSAFDTAANENGGKRSHISRKLKARCQIAYCGFLVCVHTSYFLYLVNFIVPDAIWELSTIALGVWLHLTFFSIGFLLVSLVLQLLQFRGAKRDAFLSDILLTWPPLRRLATDSRLQVTITLAATAFLCLVQYIAAGRLVVKEVTYELRGDRGVGRPPLRLAMITDLHMGAAVRRTQISSVVEAVNELNADAVLLVGDVVDAPRALIEDRAAPLRHLRSKFGSFLVSGNHEYYHGDFRDWDQLFSTSYGIRVLSNSVVNISDICLVGLSDISSNKSGIAKEAMRPEVVAQCQQNAPIIVLEHNPAAAPKILKAATDAHRHVDLILSGHTHRGQYFVLVPLVYYMLPFFYGQYTLDGSGENATQLLVSAGTLWQAAPMKMPYSSQIWLINIR